MILKYEISRSVWVVFQVFSMLKSITFQGSYQIANNFVILERK